MVKRAHNFKDLTNKRFGRLVALKLVGKNKHRKSLWLCKCDCGNETTVTINGLTSGNTKSCGCLREESVKNACRLNLTNKRFGRWLVIKKAKNGNWGTKWSCICDCGTKRDVLTGNLTLGLSISCGCLNREMTSKKHKGKKLLEETKIKLSKAAKERYKNKEDHPRFGKQCSYETKQKIAKALKNKYSKEEHPNFGRPGKFGKDNPNWNSNLTDEDRQHTRRYPGYKEWRNKVYEKDNYTCQICNDNNGGNLVAHHLESYTNNKELRTKLSNGITLCDVCHMNFHHQYGYGDNTKKQFKEFLVQDKKQDNEM